MQNGGWNVLDDDASILWREYHFTKQATATTLVFRGADGLVVVSPACDLEARDYDALREHGEVKALVANNVLHNKGIAPWRERFPDVATYAPAGAIAQLEKKTPGVAYKPLADLAPPAHVTSDTLPGFKTGETFFSIHSKKKGAVWFTGDLLTNIVKVPPPPVKWLFTWTGSAPGFRLFRPAVWLMVADKQKVRSSMLERLASDPPAAVVPAHGPPVEASDLAAQARTQLERL
jgi:hypothetical protein